jgi:hypothetical protein
MSANLASLIFFFSNGRVQHIVSKGPMYSIKDVESHKFVKPEKETVAASSSEKQNYFWTRECV